MTDMFSRPNLKSRGWTDSMIKEFLPEPDSLGSNPRYAKAAPMKWYKQERVATIELTPAFLEAKERARRRKEQAAKGVKTKLDKMYDYVENLEIQIPIMERDELIRKARRSFYSLGYMNDSTPSDEQLCVNYLRHEKSLYEIELARIAGKTGAPDAYFDLKGRVLAEIAFTYDWLSDECDRQLRKMSEQQRLQ